jgi:hypothetical protein
VSLSKIYNTITSYLYIIYSEKYTNLTKDAFVERYVAKHPLLKPELIVVNDQLHGFKKSANRLSSLEELPIYLEIEGLIEDDVYYIDSFDLYCETNISCQKRLIDMIYVSNLFSKHIKVDRNIDVANPKKETLVISSKLQEAMINSDIESIETHLDSIENAFNKNISSTLETEDSIEIKEVYIELDQFNFLLQEHLKYFVEFIKICHDMLIKNTPIDIIKKDCEDFFNKLVS